MQHGHPTKMQHGHPTKMQYRHLAKCNMGTQSVINMLYTFATIFPLKKYHSNNRTHNTTIIPQWFSLLKTPFRGECFTMFAILLS